MKAITILLFLLTAAGHLCLTERDNIYGNVNKFPTIQIAVLIRNKAHVLPFFLSYLENLNYPKDRISLWIRSDHNEDNSIEILHIWLNRTEKLYHNVDFNFNELPKSHHNETSKTDWPRERFSHIIKLKEEALLAADKLWADYIFFLDADVFLTNTDSLKHLTSYDLPIVAPMLLSEGLYSNFWCGMSDDYYYDRTDEYKEIYNNQKTGNYPVPMVHSAVLINLKKSLSSLLTFNRQKLIQNQRKIRLESRRYDGPIDDIIIFAISANSSGLEMYISNERPFGYILAPLERDDELHRDLQQLLNIKLLIINDLGRSILINNEFKKFVTYPENHRISLDSIYMINLNRRPERRRKMEMSFKELGLDVDHFPAVDGRNLSIEIIKNMGVEFLPGYEDPYHHRQMTMGEIGCFLSHYKIWERIVELNQKEVLILEDDIKFEPDFNEKAIATLEQARLAGNWDIIYFGRKRLEDQDEPWVDGVKYLVHAGYSYWTLGYVITLEGAKKLLNSNPLKNLLPVDEFLPVMFNRHPNTTWSEAFKNRNLLAYSAAPLLLYPTHYTGENGYISDTEDSLVTQEKMNAANEGQLKSDKDTVTQDNFDTIMDETNMDSKHKKSAFVKQVTDSLRKHDPIEL